MPLVSLTEADQLSPRHVMSKRAPDRPLFPASRTPGAAGGSNEKKCAGRKRLIISRLCRIGRKICLKSRLRPCERRNFVYLCTRSLRAFRGGWDQNECCCSSVVEHFLGKEEVPSSILGNSSERCSSLFLKEPSGFGVEGAVFFRQVRLPEKDRSRNAKFGELIKNNVNISRWAPKRITERNPRQQLREGGESSCPRG